MVQVEMYAVPLVDPVFENKSPQDFSQGFLGLLTRVDFFSTSLAKQALWGEGSSVLV